MKTKFLAGSALLSGLVGAAIAQTTNADAGAEPVIELKGVDCSGGRYGLRMPSTVEGYRALGPGARETSGPAVDYSGLPDTHRWHKFEYPGLSVHAVMALKEPHKGFVETAVVSDARWNKLVGIKIGMPIADILPRTKVATIPAESPWMVCGSLEGAPDCAKVHTSNGRVSKVEYQCYTG